MPPVSSAAPIPQPPSSGRSTNNNNGGGGSNALPPIHAAANSSNTYHTGSGGGGADASGGSGEQNLSSPRSRWGCGNPLTNSGSTIIGLGTVGLGDRCAAERKRMHKQSYEDWRRNKDNQEVQERLASGGTTQKAPLTSKEVYVRHRQDAQQAMERRMEMELENARKAREDAAKRKAELQQARSEDRQFQEQFRSLVTEESTSARRKRNSPGNRRETSAERTARLKQEKSAEQQVLKMVAEEHREEFQKHVSMTHDVVRKTLFDATQSIETVVQEKKKEVEQCRKGHSARQQFLQKMWSSRTEELKSMVKQQKQEHAERLAAVLEQQYTLNVKDADRIRDQRSPRSGRGDPAHASRQEEERQREHAEERKRRLEEHAALLEEHRLARKQNAEALKQAKEALQVARLEDQKEILERKQQLHNELVLARQQSPNRSVNGRSASTERAAVGHRTSGGKGGGGTADASGESDGAA